MNIRSKNLLITGGAGFIGSNYINYILNKYDNINIYNLDCLTYAGNLNNTYKFNNDKRYHFVEGNICDTQKLESIFTDYKIDGVINFAAESHVDNSIINPKVFIDTNINGVYSLLSVCVKFWMKSPFNVRPFYANARFHQISTDEIYGSIEEGSYNENDKFSPNSPYSSSKASADMLVRSFNKTYGLNTTTTVSSNNFGLNQNKEKFIPKVINHIFFSKSIPVYGDGLNVRDWIHVIDNCRAIDLVFNESNNGKVYNVGAQNELTNLEIIDEIYRIFVSINKKFKNQKIKFIEDRYGHDRRYSLDISKLKMI